MTNETSPLTGVNGARAAGQLRVARDFAKYKGSEFLFVHGIGWHHWDGCRWAADETGETRRALIDVLEKQWATSVGDVARATELKACMSASGQNGVLDIASVLPEFSAAAKEMDADPYLLNVANGTLDLRTGELREHDPADRITKVTRAAYDQQADTAEWEAFLARVLPDVDVRDYLQRFTGLALLGIVREHILGIATGTGANGKGTYYGAVQFALGDYSHVAESDLFMTIKSNANAASPAVLGLRGVRYAVCSETEEGQHLAAALMKNLTGGDSITARALYGRPITFDPSHTALMVTNHLPKVKGDDAALWRRIRVIPFDVVIPEPERDTELPERLRLSADAVLAWALAGLRDYLDSGMQTPAAVERRTSQYRTDSDDLARFVESELVDQHDGWISRSDVWKAWESFAREEKAESVRPTDLYAKLAETHEDSKRKGVRGFKGFILRTEAEAEIEFIDETQEG